jgi:hypothetical protein
MVKILPVDETLAESVMTTDCCCFGLKSCKDKDD